MSGGVTLAIDGGTPVRTAPFPAWPHVPEAGRRAVARVLESGHINYWTGTECRAFESEYAAHLGVPHALAVANGTLALEIALRALGVGMGDEVIVPSRTFIATAASVVAVGATPVVADIDPETNALTPLTIAQALTPRTRAVIVVHLGGYPADMAGILELTAQLGLKVVEDCAQAHGATIAGQPVGTFADAGCFSFCQDKILPLGEGGLIAFRDRELFERAWSYRDHGRDYELVNGTGAASAAAPASDAAPASAAAPGAQTPSFRWLTTTFGTNARLGEMEGALGRATLALLPEYVAARRANAAALADALAPVRGLRVLTPAAGSAVAPSYYRLYALLDPAVLAAGWSRDRVLAAISAEGVPVQYGSCALIGSEVAFSTIDLSRAPKVSLAGATLAHERSMAFFVHPTATVADMADIARAVIKVMAHAAPEGADL